MSDRIKAGDIVECVTLKLIHPYHAEVVYKFLRLGGYYRVEKLKRWFDGDISLFLEGIDNSPYAGWNPFRFRKVRPADDKFIHLLNRRKVDA